VRTTFFGSLLVAAPLAVNTSGQQTTPPAPQPLAEKIGPNAYDPVPNWALPYPKPGYAWGSNPGVFVESDNRILVAIRGEIKLPDPLYSWDATGTALGGFGELHELGVDSKGILCTADNVLGRLRS
jgi:hypothetical protein